MKELVSESAVHVIRKDKNRPLPRNHPQIMKIKTYEQDLQLQNYVEPDMPQGSAPPMARHVTIVEGGITSRALICRSRKEGPWTKCRVRRGRARSRLNYVCRSFHYSKPRLLGNSSG